MTKPKFANSTSSCTSAWVPITKSTVQFFSFCFTDFFCFSVKLQTSNSELIQKFKRKFCIHQKCWRASISVGAIIATWTFWFFLFSKIKWTAQTKATAVFPVQTSHSKSLCIQCVFSISFKIWKREIFWWFVNSKGKNERISFTFSGFSDVAIDFHSLFLKFSYFSQIDLKFISKSSL